MADKEKEEEARKEFEEAMQRITAGKSEGSLQGKGFSATSIELENPTQAAGKIIEDLTLLFASQQGVEATRTFLGSVIVMAFGNMLKSFQFLPDSRFLKHWLRSTFATVNDAAKIYKVSAELNTALAAIFPKLSGKLEEDPNDIDEWLSRLYGEIGSRAGAKFDTQECCIALGKLGLKLLAKGGYFAKLENEAHLKEWCLLAAGTLIAEFANFGCLKPFLEALDEFRKKLKEKNGKEK